ncbi:MAG: PKD domain-containing protein [Planctomycetes bacterium]|nr:PKD domain-containing protein [Planctomycetota bacterium]
MPIAQRLKRAMRTWPRFLVLLGFAIGVTPPVSAERPAWQDESRPYRRQVSVLPLETGVPAVVTTDFFAHGQLAGENPAVTVYARGERVPSRVLQVGPGDFCRVAFQTRKSEPSYQVYYGGDATAAEPLTWTATDGLLYEARRWKECNLRQLDSVRDAYESSQRLGSDYVSQVYHRHNPFAVQPAPFLSHYSGTLKIQTPGLYQFFTSSEDCSFLQIDGRTVVSLPGRHRPVGQARFKGEVQLTAGEHRFDYWHAAGGQETCAVAAWQVPGADRLELIPAGAFGSDRTAHVAAQNAEHVTDGPLPDFRLAIRGEAPIDDDDQWAVRVEFEGAGPVLDRTSTCSWDFGDGQTATQWQLTHVYLRPGEYSVAFRVRRRGKDSEVTHRVPITRFIQQEGTKNADTLDDYLPILDGYEFAALDGQSQLRMVLLRLQREEWAKAVETGLRAGAAAGPGDDGAMGKIAAALDTVARLQLGDPASAFQLWRKACQASQDPRDKARCALAAADIALNELLQVDKARPLLAAADAHFRESSGLDGARLARVWGDWHARHGDAAAALAAYQQAAAKRELALSIAQQHARRGAYSRSAEAFLRENDLPRAGEQLSQWQQDFPRDKSEGYLSLLLVRYWTARNLPRVALASANDLLTVAPQSPYADRLLLAQADAEELLGRVDRALAVCQSLLTDYPGSPLHDAAKEKIAALKNTAATKTERTGARKATKEDLKEARGGAGLPDSGEQDR